jgi:effector-binding domain-containing protein
VIFGGPDTRFTGLVDQYEIEVAAQPRRPIAAVGWSTSWEAFPGEWRSRLDEVYAWLRQAGRHGGCNVMFYRDLPEPRQMAVEVGVELSGPFEPAARVRPSALPAGPAAVTIHRGPYEELGAAHRAVAEWCAAHGHDLAGERWEVYGDWHEDPRLLETQIFYRLAEVSPEKVN